MGLCLLVIGATCLCVIASAPLVVYLDVTNCETHPHHVGVLDTRLSLLRVMLCLRCATCLAFFTSFHFCSLPTCSCISPCLLVSSSLISIISCGFTPIFNTQEPKSLLGVLFNGTCVVHTPISWNHGHPIQTYICPPRTPPSFRLITCLFAPVWFSLLVSLSVCSLFPFAISFACLLACPLLVACTCLEWDCLEQGHDDNFYTVDVEAFKLHTLVDNIW